MQYILLICSDEKHWASLSEEEMQKVYAQYGAYSKALADAGILRGGAELKPISTATTVRSVNGKKTIVDGPFAETKEQLGGFILIEAKDLNEAMQIASKMPSGNLGAIEVRPIRELSAT